MSYLQVLFKSRDDSKARNLRSVSSIGLILVGSGAMILPNLIGIGFNSYVASVFAMAAFAFLLNQDAEQLNWVRPFLLILLALVVLFDSRVTGSVLGLIASVFYACHAAMEFSRTLSRDSVYSAMFGLSALISALTSALLLSNWSFSSAISMSVAYGLPIFASGAARFLVWQYKVD